MATGICFDTTISHAGISFYSFLNAKDLASVNFCSKDLYNETRQHIFNVCLQQLPLNSHDDDATDTLNVYLSDENLTFPESKQAFSNETVGLLHQNGVKIEDNGESVDQIALAKRSSFLKLVADDGFKAHFSLGFKRKSFKSRNLNLFHAIMFADDGYLEDETEQRVLIKQWIYLLTSSDCVSVSTWHAMFVFGTKQSYPVGGSGMIFTHTQTGESIEFVRRMSRIIYFQY
ncbi:hypothetical protein ACHAWO_012581 [Cyclotella atomus]|uniref:Uncharacterized protein n=1 Tax=Cyclotella atomus TaxID=382360 RepID=A0ABD3QBY5_9STRA